MGNQSQDVRNHNKSTQSSTQNETGVVTWSNQEECDEASVEYILAMMDNEIESTTPEAAIFEDKIEEDNDQDDTEEDDDKDISLFELKEEEELMTKDRHILTKNLRYVLVILNLSVLEIIGIYDSVMTSA